MFRNPDFMFNDTIEEFNIPEIICDLYEYLHILITGNEYDYMFHWANKCCAWVETGYFDKIIKEWSDDHE